jgi:hypothetical protein
VRFQHRRQEWLREFIHLVTSTIKSKKRVRSAGQAALRRPCPELSAGTAQHSRLRSPGRGEDGWESRQASDGPAAGTSDPTSREWRADRVYPAQAGDLCSTGCGISARSAAIGTASEIGEPRAGS